MSKKLQAIKAELPRFGHTLHICFSCHLWVLLFALGGATLITILQCQVETSAVALHRARVLMEVITPLATMAAICHIFTVDYDAGFHEVLRTYPAGRTALAVERLAAGLLFAFSVVLVVVSATQYYTPLAAYSAWLTFTPSGGFLMGITLLVASLTRNWVASLSSGAVYWCWEIITRGKVTGVLFLFPQTLRGLSGIDLAATRLIVTLSACFLITVAVLIYRRQLNPH